MSRRGIYIYIWRERTGNGGWETGRREKRDEEKPRAEGRCRPHTHTHTTQKLGSRKEEQSFCGSFAPTKRRSQPPGRCTQVVEVALEVRTCRAEQSAPVWW